MLPRILLAIALTSAVGCSASRTSVTHLWRDDSVRVPMRSVLVFGMQLDEATRRAVEDELVTQLSKNNVNAHPSYEIFATSPNDVDTARAKVNELQFQGLLVVTMKDVREKTVYEPGRYQPNFWTTYGYAGGGWYTPGYVTTEEEVSFESTLWDTRAADRLVWTALTRTTNPSAGRDFVRSLAKTVVPSLKKSGFIPM